VPLAPRPTPGLFRLYCSAYHVFMSVPYLDYACLMECSFSLNVSFFILWQFKMEVCQRFVCMVFVNSPHHFNGDHVERCASLPYIPVHVVGDKHAMLCFCFSN